MSKVTCDLSVSADGSQLGHNQTEERPFGDDGGGGWGNRAARLDVRQCREAAGDGDVSIHGGANTINQYLAAGLIDELRLHIVPLTLGADTRIFDGVPAPQSRAAGFAGSELDHTRDLSRAVLNRTVWMPGVKKSGAVRPHWTRT